MTEVTINKQDAPADGDAVASAQDSDRPVRMRIAAESIPTMALEDLWIGLKRTDLWWATSLHETRQRFRRSLIGPLWLTLSMGIFIGALGYVMTQLFGQDPSWFLPYLATGIIFWTLLTSIINEAGTAFVSQEKFIRNVPMPLSVHYYRMIARNIIIWLHNMVIFVLVFLIFQHSVNVAVLAFIPGFMLFMAVVTVGGLCIAIVSTRFRDIPQVVGSLLQVVFFVTPIFWSVTTFPERPVFVVLNPAYHLLEIVRAPLLGELPSLTSWLVSLGLLLVAIPIALYLYRRAYARIPYWV